MMSGGGSRAMSEGAMGSEVDMDRKTCRECLNVSESGISRLNHLSTFGPACFLLRLGLLFEGSGLAG